MVMGEKTRGRRRELRGVLCTLLGGICWGFSGSCGQFLFQNYTVDTKWLTTIRLIIAGIILIIFGMIKNRDSMLRILKDRADMGRLLIFAVLGLMFCQYAYLKAISHSNAGTATVLQYLGPLMIMIYTCIRSKRAPDRIEVLSIIFAVAGVFVLATHGSLDSMVITKQGLIWGLLAALGLALYSLIPVGIIGKWGSVPISGYGMLIGGIALCIISTAWNIKVDVDANGVLAMAGIILVGTVIAFTLYLQGVNDIGVIKASMIACIEPAAATVFAAVWLKTKFTLIDIIGFAFILTTVVLLSNKKGKAAETEKRV